MSNIAKTDPLDVIVAKLQIGTCTRHILFCAGPKCCSDEAGMELWTHMKTRLKEKALVGARLLRTKVHCLRICRDGPIAVVYPEGTWYNRLDKAKCDEIIERHMLRGEVISEYSFATNPLPPQT